LQEKFAKALSDALDHYFQEHTDDARAIAAKLGFEPTPQLSVEKPSGVDPSVSPLQTNASLDVTAPIAPTDAVSNETLNFEASSIKADNNDENRAASAVSTPNRTSDVIATESSTTSIYDVPKDDVEPHHTPDLSSKTSSPANPHPIWTKINAWDTRRLAARAAQRKRYQEAPPLLRLAEDFFRPIAVSFALGLALVFILPPASNVLLPKPTSEPGRWISARLEDYLTLAIPLFALITIVSFACTLVGQPHLADHGW
jgi:hypothetical protein